MEILLKHNQTIAEQVGNYFLKFCGKYELSKVSDSAEQFCQRFCQACQGEV